MKKIYKLTAALLCTAMLTACTAGQQQTTQTQTAATAAEQTTTVTTTETTTETTTVTTTETTTVTTTETEATTTELAFEDTPENAYQRLAMSFIQENGDEIAPDDYGGVYSYAGTLFVALTEYKPSEYYTNLLSEYTCVIYKKVRLSFNTLSDICERANELLAPEFGVGEYYVNVPTNKAVITIKEGDPKKAQNFLKTVEDRGFELHDLEIIMAEPEQTEQ